MTPREMRGAEWVEWMLGPGGERAYHQALLDRGVDPEDRFIAAESMPILIRKIKACAESLHRLRDMQRSEGASPEHVIATEAAIDALANFDAALVHERYFTAREACPCRVCRSQAS